MIDPQKFAETILNDIEMATAEAWDATENWDYDRLRRAFKDIGDNVQSWIEGPK